MNEAAPTPRRKRPALIVAATTILLALLALGLGVALLPGRSADLLAAGFEGSLPRIRAAFSPEVDAATREAVVAEVEAQVRWLRGREAAGLTPEAARASAQPAERLTDLLADDALDPADCRSFLELARRVRGAVD